MKIASVVGARPQFIKAAPVSREIRQHHEEILIHTGQHYDENMSDVFFEILDIPRPNYNLGVGSGSHGRQTADMMRGLEEVLEKESPNLLLVYGDTNSTLAGALVAAKMGIPLGHVEAGLRSFNRQMPEEVNRVVADHLSSLLFAPTETAVENLTREGITRGVHMVGDVMYDVALQSAQAARSRDVLSRLGLTRGEYLLVTLHRPQNVDDQETLSAIVEALVHAGRPVVFPVHPRTRKNLVAFDLWDRLQRTAAGSRRRPTSSACRASPCATRRSGSRPWRTAGTPSSGRRRTRSSTRSRSSTPRGRNRSRSETVMRRRRSPGFSTNSCERNLADPFRSNCGDHRGRGAPAPAPEDTHPRDRTLRLGFLVNDIGAWRPESHVLVILIGFAGDPFVGQPFPGHFIHRLHFSQDFSHFDDQLLEQFIVFLQQCRRFSLRRHPNEVAQHPHQPWTGTISVSSLVSIKAPMFSKDAVEKGAYVIPTRPLARADRESVDWPRTANPFRIHCVRRRRWPRQALWS